MRSSGWKTALETIAANTKPTIIEHRGEGNNGIDPQLLASMQEHWHRAELQLAEKLSEMQQKVRVRTTGNQCNRPMWLFYLSTAWVSLA